MNTYRECWFAGLLSLLALNLFACGGGIPVVSDYRSPYLIQGHARRSGPHAGVDIAGQQGDPVLATADGSVVWLIDDPAGCGNGVVLGHTGFRRYSIYCHLQKVLVKLGRSVERGETIGLLGDTGFASTCRPACPHVHLELSDDPYAHDDGNLKRNYDPLENSGGCFDPRKSYPTDRLILTYPIKC
jgi:murein DD-endopeptidase MepM/ murein hydrolase activator NlpD